MSINSVNRYHRMQGTSAASTPKPAKESKDQSSGARMGGDRVQISSDAAIRFEASSRAKIYSANWPYNASQERIAELRQKYQGDECPVSGHDIAAAILSGPASPE